MNASLRPIATAALAAALAACAGSTIRPTDDAGAVAPAPSEAPSPPVVDQDPAPTPAPAPEAPDAAGSPAAESDTVSPSDGAPVEIRRIGRWVSSNIRGSRRLVIRDPATWAQFWSELGAGVRPEVNFSRDLVIAVASGERSTGGHDIVVQRVTRSDGDLRITVVETSPGPNCMTTMALTQPVDVIMVPAAGVTGWSFIDSTATSTC
ncbi:MAG TPA: protease complex subunit PrcB family protein [Gemmatimonadales bacterium]|nr:protease complex subunit PrcB family protein [Gemmatimonadales bacterium]